MNLTAFWLNYPEWKEVKKEGNEGGKKGEIERSREEVREVEDKKI